MLDRLLKTPLIAPSLLAVWDKSGGDYGAVSASASEALRAGADWLHIDVMDGKFVPAVTFGAEMLTYLRESVKQPPQAVLDVHLMVREPEAVIPLYVAAGADRLVFHPTATRDVAGCLGMINDTGRAGGLALDIDEPVKLMKHYARSIRQVLLMTVKAGAGGQAFRPEMLAKIAEIRDLLGDVTVVVDGGINARTAPLAQAAGADVLVAGSYVFSAPNYADALAALRASA